MPESTNAIEAMGLVKLYAGRRAVDGVDLAIPTGSIYGVLGPNGAGKSSTLRMLLGVVEPDEGRRVVLGEHDPRRVVRRIGFLPEERSLYQQMTARDSIAFMGALRGMRWREARARGTEMLDRFGLGSAATTRVRRLSKGQAQLVQLVCAIVHRPDLLVLDEPFSGLDPINQGIMERIITEERDRGATVLFSTHVMGHAERMCDRIVVIAGGRVRFEGTVDQARSTLPQTVRWRPERDAAAAERLLPRDSRLVGGEWIMAQDAVIDEVLAAVVASGLGTASFHTEKASLHDAFVSIIGADAGEDAR
jgi:ABC-2 type transport system ATP-binding protein